MGGTDGLTRAYLIPRDVNIYWRHKTGVKMLKEDREEGLCGLKPREALPTQSLIQMMCREMLVLEERELVSVEVKEKMEGRKELWGTKKDRK